MRALDTVFGALPFSHQGNPYDGKTLPPTLERIKKLFSKDFKVEIVDKGYRGREKIGETEVVLPGKRKFDTEYQKRKHKQQCRRRSAVEATIGHLKSDHRMGRNYLKAIVGDQNNALLAGMGLNFKQLIA